MVRGRALLSLLALLALLAPAAALPTSLPPAGLTATDAGDLHLTAQAPLDAARLSPVHPGMWTRGPAAPHAPPALTPPEGLPTIAAAAPLPLLGADLGYTIVARSGGVERIVAGDPVVPRPIRLAAEPSPTSRAPLLGTPGGDILVWATGLAGVPLLSSGFTFSVQRLTDKEIPLEIYFVRTDADGTLSYAGYRTDATPKSLAVDVRAGTGLTGEGDNVAIRLRSSTSTALVTLVAGKTRPHAATATHEAVEIAFAPLPEHATLNLARSPSTTRLAWDLDAPLALAARYADPLERFAIQWTQAPPQGRLEATRNAQGASFAYEASAPGGAVYLGGKNGQDVFAVHALQFPQTWSLALNAKNARYQASQPVPLLGFGIAQGTQGAMLVEAHDLPTRLDATTERDTLRLEASAPVGNLRAFSGDLPRCLSTDAGAFLAVVRAAPDPARASASECASLALPGLQTLTLATTPQGGFQFRSSVETHPDKPIQLHARYDGGPDDGQADLRITPLPREATWAIEQTDGALKVDARASQRVQVEGLFSSSGPLQALDAPDAGIALTSSAQGTRAALRLPQLPRNLHLRIDDRVDPDSATDPTTPSALHLLLPDLPDRLHADLHLAGTAQRPATSFTWQANAPSGRIEALVTRAHDGWLRATLGALPTRGAIHLGTEGLRFDLPEAPSLEITAASPKPGQTLTLEAATHLQAGAIVTDGAQGTGIHLRLPRAPATGRINWSAGLDLTYQGLALESAFRIGVRDGNTRTQGEVRLPHDAEMRARNNDGATEFTWRGSDGPSPAHFETQGARGPGRLDVASAPRQFQLAYAPDAASPQLRYEGSDRGATLTAGGQGDAFGLGRGGGLTVADAPREFKIQRDAGDGTLSLRASDPMNATLRLGEKRWGGPVMGFTTKDTVVDVQGAREVDVKPGPVRTTISGDDGTVTLDHAPTDPGNELFVIVDPNDGPADTAWNHAKIPLKAGRATAVWHSLNPLLLFHVSPMIAFGLAGAFLGESARRLWKRAREQG